MSSVRGAALAQLLAGGQLTDTGRAVAANRTQRPADEVLDLVLGEVADGEPRDWRRPLHQSKSTLKAVEHRLLRVGAIEPRGRNIVAVIQAKARELLDDEVDIAGIHVLDAALVALAFVVPLRTVFARGRKHHDQVRVAALTHRAADGAPGFERLIQQMRYTRGRAYSAGGPVH